MVGASWSVGMVHVELVNDAQIVQYSLLQFAKFVDTRFGVGWGKLDDVSPIFDGSAIKHILEKAVEIAVEVKSTSEWHRRMTHEGHL